MQRQALARDTEQRIAVRVACQRSQQADECGLQRWAVADVPVTCERGPVVQHQPLEGE
jgi:hypothetical protein